MWLILNILSIAVKNVSRSILCKGHFLTRVEDWPGESVPAVRSLNCYCGYRWGWGWLPPACPQMLQATLCGFPGQALLILACKL